MNDGNLVRQKVSLKWLNQTNNQLTYRYGDVCNGNFPKCILTRVLHFFCEEPDSITLSSEGIIGSVRLQMGAMGTMISRMRMRKVLQNQLKRMKAKNHSR